MLESIIQSKSKAFFVLCFCFIIGIASISVFDFYIDFIYLSVAFFVSIIFVWMYWKNKLLRFISLCMVMLLFGFLRYQWTIPIDSSEHIIHFAGQKKTVIGYIMAEPDIRLDGVRYIVKIQKLVEKGKNMFIDGNIYLKSSSYPKYEYGDMLEITCSLRKPEPVEDFRYDKYLARYHVFVICQGAKINKIDDGKGNKFLSIIFTIKQKIAKKINVLWHEPMASFMAGLLYGYRGGLGNLNELFSRTGVTHIVAISGYNITIIATILMVICSRLYIPRKKAFWFISLGIFIFVLFAGASASVVRAGIMGIIVLLAKQVGRSSQVGNVMMLTAVIMTLHNPYILMWDAGFQLSFISTLGLVYITPFIEKLCIKFPEIFGIKESLISTIAAIMATLPLILFQFGRLSIVAPFVNVLILWIIPAIMMIGFFAVIMSFIFYPIALILSWFAWVGMKYIVIIVEFFAGLHFAAVDIHISWVMMVGLYIVMIYFIYIKNKKNNYVKKN